MAFIKGIGIISPQNTFGTPDFLSDIAEAHSNSLRCIEPNYGEFINPAMGRRMGRVIKMGIGAATVCLRDAGVEMPDAIITGTGLGCWEDTEKFLTAIIDNDEQFLTPTSFIQSTHNTVGAQIALQLKCTNYNFTYVHKGFSFEAALLDGLMTLNEGEAKNVLIGAHDEMTDKFFQITSRAGYWKENAVHTMELINSKTKGSISGEGAAFFVLSNQPGDTNYAKLVAVETIYKPANEKEVEDKITQLLKENYLTSRDIDIALYGIGGDSRYDGIYYSLMKKLFSYSSAAYYKHLCGEYQTSTGFALWLAAMLLKRQTVPASIIVGDNTNNGKGSKPIKNLLIYNSYRNENHSVFLLQQY